MTPTWRVWRLWAVTLHPWFQWAVTTWQAAGGRTGLAVFGTVCTSAAWLVRDLTERTERIRAGAGS